MSELDFFSQILQGGTNDNMQSQQQMIGQYGYQQQQMNEQYG